MPETALGLFPDVGGSYFLPRLPGKLGMFLALTGYRLKGADVFHAGLATHYVDSSSVAELENALKNLPKEKCDKETVSKTITSFQPKSIPEFSLKGHLDTINKTFDGKSVEDIIQKLEKDGSKFSAEQASALTKMVSLLLSLSTM